MNPFHYLQKLFGKIHILLGIDSPTLPLSDFHWLIKSANLKEEDFLSLVLAWYRGLWFAVVVSLGLAVAVCCDHLHHLLLGSKGKGHLARVDTEKVLAKRVRVIVKLYMKFEKKMQAHRRNILNFVVRCITF